MEKSKKFLKRYWLILVSIGIIFILAVLYFILPEFHKFTNRTGSVLLTKDEDKISAYFKGLKIWGPFLIAIIMLLQVFLVFIPSMLMMIVAVLGYGPFWGSVISLTVTCITSTVAFFLGKSFEGKTRIHLIGAKRYENWQRFVQRYGFCSMMLFRVSPFVSNDAVSIIAGVCKMSYWKFLAATMAGTLPLVAAIAWFARDIETLKEGLYWIGGGGVVIYLIYIWLNKINQPK